MNLLASSGLVNFLACIGLAYIVWKNRPGDKVAKAYAIFNCTVAFFSFFYFVWQLSPSAEQATIWFKLVVMGIIWINQAYIYFVLTFFGDTHKPLQRNILIVCAVLNGGCTYLDLAGKMFTGLQPRFNLGYWPTPTWWFSAYLVFWHVEILYGFMELLKGFWRKDLVTKQLTQLKYFVVAFSIGYFGGANNWPMWYGVHFPPYLNNLIAIYIGIVAYAILYHQIMDVRLVLRDTTLHLATASLLAGGCMVIGIPLAAWNPYVGVVCSVAFMGLCMAFAYEPIRRALQPALDRLMFANRFAYLEELAQLPNDMLEFTNMREMLKFLVTRLTAAGKLEHTTVYMYNPAQQAYPQTIQYQNPDIPKTFAPIDPQASLGQDSALTEIIRTDNRLWFKEALMESAGPYGGAALMEMQRLRAAAFFGVMRQQELVGIVILGAKITGRAFNQNDMKILQALKMRLENFLLQAMVTTQESLNMVKDSHDMKNDVNALSGRLSMKRFKMRTQEKAINSKVQNLEQALMTGPVDNKIILEQLALIKSTVCVTSSEQQALLPIEEDALERLRNKLQNWSVYGRLIAGGFEGSQKIEPIDISGVAKICIERWRPAADRKDVALSLQSEENIQVMGERSLVEQILDNLVDNAVKATDQGSVTVSCRRVEKQIIIQVKDTGSGIPDEDLLVIFTKPFYQGNGQHSLEKSTGVGLVLVSQYAKSLKGDVKVESQSGKGSTFSVYLPAMEESHTAA